MRNKNLFISVIIKLTVFVVFGLFCFFNIFKKLDYRLYDAMVTHRREPLRSEKIMLVKIDDPSIKEFGEWPWSRDIIADALLRMKELGADSAIFDIEYISPTKYGIAPSAENKILSKIYYTEEELKALLFQLSNAIKAGYYKSYEIPELINQMIQGNVEPSFEVLQDYILNNMARDNDEYFARCLQFFGKSYLTINHDDMGYDVTEEARNYIMNRMLTDSVTDTHNLIALGNEYTSAEEAAPVGFNPALHKLMTRAAGASFTNSVVDADGVRRRMQLLYNYNGKYINQLAFGPYLEMVGSKELVREKDRLIIKNAKNPVNGKTEDIKIPLDDHGRLLINYRHGSCDISYKNDSIINLIRLDIIEEQIIKCLTNIASDLISGKDGEELEYTTGAYQLLDMYDSICQMKEDLLAKCTGYNEDGTVKDGIREEEYSVYFRLRNDFYNAVSTYTKSKHLEKIQNRLKELLNQGYIDQVTFDDKSGYFIEDFDNLNYFIQTFLGFVTEMRPLYKGTYCFIGNTATSTTDIGATPYETQYMNVGIHANIMNTLINQDFIVNIKWYWGFLLAAALSFGMLAFKNLDNAQLNLFATIIYMVYCIVFGAMFLFGKYYIQFIGTILFLLTDLFASIGYRYFLSVKEKQFITQIAASFANKDTVNELRKNPDAFKTEGQKKCITALFSDIQKFSTLSENIGKLYGDEGPNKLIEILNEYLGQMSNEILVNTGTIDKYEGDAIISMFGAPDPMNTHTPQEWAYLCLDSAIRMKKVEVEFNKQHRELFEPKEITKADGTKEIITLKPLQTRIGVNSGEAFVGLMGSKTDAFSKLNYTMIGDTVNLASRLEGVNKAYGSWIMCSDDTWNMADSGANKGKITVKRLDKVRVVGRSTPVQLYSIVGFTEELTQAQNENIQIFHTALDKYLQRDFANAGKLFMKANSIGDGDPIALVFADRCKNFLENGVEKNWDGVINMTSK